MLGLGKPQIAHVSVAKEKRELWKTKLFHLTALCERNCGHSHKITSFFEVRTIFSCVFS
jgi:hypothetical protein